MKEGERGCKRVKEAERGCKREHLSALLEEEPYNGVRGKKASSRNLKNSSLRKSEK